MYVNVHSHVWNIIVDKIFSHVTKYTVLDEQRHEAKEGKSQHKNPRSITRGATPIRLVLLEPPCIDL